MSRIEHTNVFYSVEEEQEFLLDLATTVTLTNNLDSTIFVLNASPELLTRINCRISRSDLWKMMFQSIRATYIFKQRRNVVVIYASMKTYVNKFVGLSGDAVSLTTKELAAKFGIPGSKCICFNITSEGNYSK